MGSFNTICAVSKTPILEGQKVRVFFLVMNSFPMHYSMEKTGLFNNIYMGSNCYPHDNFSILGYPLLAKYADYGNYDFLDEDMSNLVLKKINEMYVPNRIQEGKEEKDYNRSHDYLNIEKLESMDQVQDIESSGSLRVKSYHGITAVAKMAIHEEIYQELIISGKISRVKNRTDRNSYTFKEHVNYYKTALKDQSKAEIEPSSYLSMLEEQIEKLKKDLNSEEEIKDKQGNIVKKEDIEKNINDIKEILATERYRKLFNEDQNKDYLYSSEISEDLFENDFQDKIIEAWCAAQWTNTYFSNYNLEFAPVILGGQCYDYKYDANNLRKMANIVEKLKPRWADEESIPTEVNFIKKVTLSISEMKEKMEDWFSKKDEEYKNYKTVVNELKEKGITSYVVGDESNFDLFAEGYELINEEKGTEIHFKFD